MPVRKANEMLLRTQEKLIQTEKLATLGVIAGGIAHELNSPLASISMTTQLIEIDVDSVDNNDLRESLKESLNLIKEGAKKSGIIIKDFYDYIEKHKSELNLSSDAEYDLYVKGNALKKLVDSLIKKKDEDRIKKSNENIEKDN